MVGVVPLHINTNRWCVHNLLVKNSSKPYINLIVKKRGMMRDEDDILEELRRMDVRDYAEMTARHSRRLML